MFIYLINFGVNLAIFNLSENISVFNIWFIIRGIGLVQVTITILIIFEDIPSYLHNNGRIHHCSYPIKTSMPLYILCIYEWDEILSFACEWLIMLQLFI